MKELLARFHTSKKAQVGGAITLLLVLVAIFGPRLAPHSYKAQDLDRVLAPPVWDLGGTWSFPLGTDNLGRDLLSRMIYGAGISLSVGAGAVLVGGILGTLLGILSGFFGGRVDQIVMRVADIQLSFPAIFLAIAIMAFMGQGVLNLVAVLGFVTWVQYARVARSSTLVTKETEFVEAARALGATSGRILLRHVFPNVLPPLIVIATVNVSSAILAEAGLSFLGLGVQPPLPTWGGMLSEGRQVFSIAWWNVVFPGLAILIAVFGINLLGDGLCDGF
jgi:ABC-type dipeptide/oligopeptide/nickel transport system permease subunit